MTNILDELEKIGEEFSVTQTSNDNFKIQEGNNKMRILTKFEVIGSHYLGPKNNRTCYGKDKGCPYHGEKDGLPRPRFLMYVLDSFSSFSR